MIRRFLLTCLIVLGCVQSAAAHTRSQSFSDWTIEGSTASAMIAVDARRITQLGTLYPELSDLPKLYAQHVRETIDVIQDGEACSLTNLSPVGDGREVFRLRVTFACKAPILASDTRARIGLFFKVSPTHIHLARIQGELGHDFVLREGQTSFQLKQVQAPQSLWGFISVGFHHVLSGLDHLVFLVGLALVARRPKLAILCVTGFTLGHTAALGLSTYGLIAPDVRLVEALIGFTIAVMALEAGTMLGLSRLKAMMGFAVFAFLIAIIPVGLSPSIPVLGVLLAVYCVATGLMPPKTALSILPVITIAFGLVHGAGFAGGLRELSLSQADIFPPLLGFNVGVELAQLLALVLVYALGWALTRTRGDVALYAQQLASILIFGMGTYWFAVRVWM